MLTNPVEALFVLVGASTATLPMARLMAILLMALRRRQGA